MIEQWLLIVWISVQPPLWIPIVSYDIKEDCYAALEQWEVDQQGRVSCVSAMIEPLTKKRTRRREERESK